MTPHGAERLGRPPISAVMVVVPAHDEEGRIGACIRSVRRAADVLRGPTGSLGATGPAPVLGVRQIEIVVALDDCRDGTAVAVGDPSVHLVHLEARCVGAARRVGIESGMTLLGDHDPGAVLVANTDADCLVPPDWLTDLVSLAGAHDVVLGEVEPDPSEMSTESLEAWWLRNPRGRGSLHGANLALRLDTYLGVGGSPRSPTRRTSSSCVPCGLPVPRSWAAPG